MSQNVIALIYAAFACSLGWGVLLVAGRSLLDPQQLPKLLVGWILLTVLLFLIPTGTLFLLLAAVIILGLRAAGLDPFAIWLFLIVAIPTAGLRLEELPFGIKYLFDFSFAILLALVIGIPLLFERRRRTVGSGAAAVDALFVVGAVLMILLSARGANLTTWMRTSFLIVVTMVIPYLAVSRRLRTINDVDQATRLLVCSYVVISLVGLVGALIGWAIYDTPERRLFDNGGTAYILRAGLTRSGGTLGSAPIVFGTLMAFGATVLLGLRSQLGESWRFAALMGACLAGLVASVSRGPLLGLVLGLVAYQFTQPNATRGLVRLGLIAPLVVLPFVLFTSTGREMLAMLPFIGSEGDGTVSYRQDLLVNGAKVVMRYPLFGTPTFLQEPDLQVMIQGQGIIDIVNAYLGWALQYGLLTAVPLTIAVVLSGVLTFRVTRRMKGNDPETMRWRQLGGALFAAQVGFAFTIGTVSLVALLPVMTWIYLGLQVAFVRTANAWLAERAAGAHAAEDAGEPAAQAPPEAAAPAPDPVPAAAAAPRPAASFGPQTSLEEVGLEGFTPIGGTR